MSFRNITNRLSTFFNSPRGKTVIKWTQRLINTGILIWLIYQLQTIGWDKFFRSLPVEPWFYILFILIFFQLPLFEVLIYRMTWTFKALPSIPIFLVKRVYNKDVMGYSGELYFFVWAKKNLRKSGTEIFQIIKDNNIISSVASTLISIGLLVAFLFTDQIKIIAWIANQNQTYFLAGLLLVSILIFLFIRFRHSVISMPFDTAYKIFGIQIVRLIFGQALNLAMYYVVMPDIPFHIWFTFIAVEIIISRIPFLPNRDLIFAGMSISMAGSMMISKDAIAGITIAKSVLNKIVGVASFGLANLFKESGMVPEINENGNPFEEFKNTEQAE